MIIGVISEKFIYKKYLKIKNLFFGVCQNQKKMSYVACIFKQKKTQAKIVSVVKGKILDVVIDCRKKSKTFGKYYKITLSDKNCKALMIPSGFAHGFLALGKENIIFYGCDNYRSSGSEVTIKWDDPNVNIKWPSNKKKILSKKDNAGKSFSEFIKDIK